MPLVEPLNDSDAQAYRALGGFTRHVEVTPAYDKPNRGIGSAEITWYLKGAKGAVQFKLMTGWHLPHLQQELKTKHSMLAEPLPADLGYHAYAAQYEGQERSACRVLDGQPCYYDGSGLNAKRVFDVLLAEGDEGLWRELHAAYVRQFGCD